MWFFLSLYFALWTSVGTLILKKLTRNLHPSTILLASNLFIIPLAFLAIIILGGIPKVSADFYRFVFSSSLFDVVAFFASMWAIKLSPISLISPISSFNPVFTTLIAAVTLHEVPTLTKFIGILLIVAGAYSLNIADIKDGFFAPIKRLVSDRGVQLSFLAYFIWAITPIFQKQAIFQTQPTMPIFASFFGILLVTLLALPFTLRKTVREIGLIRMNVGWFIFIAPFNVLAQLAGFTAFSLANLGYVTAIFKLSILFTILWGWLIFKEERIKERLLGGGVMLLGTVLLVL